MGISSLGQLRAFLNSYLSPKTGPVVGAHIHTSRCRGAWYAENMRRLSLTVMTCLRGVSYSACAISLCISGIAFADEEANPDRLRGVVFDICTDCHRVPAYPSKEPAASVDAPSFGQIAQNPKTYSEERLRTFLRKPHFPMTGFVLSDRDIEDLMAFIREQRE